MPLADEIRAVRDRALAELAAAHDYHADSEQVWSLIDREIVTAGRKIGYSNPVTGTVTTEVELSARIAGHVKDRLRESTFQTFLAVFEVFFSDLVRIWLRAYPHALAGKSDVAVDVILDAPDKPAIVDFLIDRAVGGLFYKKPADWFAYLEKRLKLGCPSTDEVAQLAEAKATRDVLTHNSGVANDRYVQKAGDRARHAAGERVDIPDAYHRETWDLLRKVVTDLSTAMLAKFP